MMDLNNIYFKKLQEIFELADEIKQKFYSGEYTYQDVIEELDNLKDKINITQEDLK